MTPMRHLRVLSRVALFAALVYVLSWATTFLPNVSLIFFLVFTAGYVWGTIAGMIVGAVGMGLWTAFNPFGPAMPPIMIAQIGGAAMSGVVGGLATIYGLNRQALPIRTAILAICSLICTVLFFLPVNLVDAWLFQPFWPRFISSSLWSLISVGSNLIIFPLLYPVLAHLYATEGRNP
jgi:uncharacterized membrane protein